MIVNNNDDSIKIYQANIKLYKKKLTQKYINSLGNDFKKL